MKNLARIIALSSTLAFTSLASTLADTNIDGADGDVNVLVSYSVDFDL